MRAAFDQQGGSIEQPDGPVSKSRPLRVCYFGTYRAGYNRNKMMIEGLRRAGHEVVECHQPLWKGIEDRVATASGGWTRPGFLWRALKAYATLLWWYRRVGQYDVMVVGYPGQVDVFPARVLTWLSGRPLVWDILMSVYLVALERGLDRRSPFTIRLLKSLEWLACRLPDRLILDTPQYVAWFGETHGVPADRFRLAPIGADDRVFGASAMPMVAPPPDSRLTVLYYGTYIPNHGVEHIVGAARLLDGDAGIRFEMIGDGPDRARAETLAAEWRLTNVEFIDWMPREELVRRARDAEICLGAFGTTPQSLMTVHNKIYEGLSLGRPVITGDSAAVRGALVHGEQVYLCERASARAIADAILALRYDIELRARLSSGGRRVYYEKYSLAVNGWRFAGYLAEMVGSR